MDNVSFAIGIARAMGSNRNSHPSGGLSCVAPLLFSRVGHHSDPYRTPFRGYRTPFQCLGKLSGMPSESLSDIHRNRCPIWIGTSVRFESEPVSDMHRNTQSTSVFQKSAKSGAEMVQKWCRKMKEQKWQKDDWQKDGP